MEDRPPLPPLTLETARQKVQADRFVKGRQEIVQLLTEKWESTSRA